MNKRIRINGKLYEAVEPSRNRSRRVRSMNESYGKKVTEHDLYYMGLGGAYAMPWGPCVEWDNGEVLVVLASDDGQPENNPAISIQTMDEEENNYEPSFVAATREGYYSADKEGYDNASDDFQSVCKALDRGSSPQQVARRFRMEVFDL